MLGETYDITPDETGRTYTFTSIGPKGVIEKMVLFQSVGFRQYNLAFGDLKRGRVNDKIVSSNDDIVKVLSTVAKCAYEFLKENPGVTIEIIPVDERRKMLYNLVFKRHHKILMEKFSIFGMSGDEPEPYDPAKDYDGFELNHLF